MWTVYILKSEEGMNYTGMSSNFADRIIDHNSGKNYTTRRGTNWKLVYSEKCKNAKEARTREKYFKNNAGKEWLKRRGYI
ncbi:MAG: GIY-YIG nuclease family protein [Candidatus Marinimicrobia bacterium]|jgi:predicted GIY-YIG superfamily endonuclease|nr:GIY-YIG nuclease family protein [Candidatus Neomarinimicrobiota bacterium]MBT4307521.1 GIY-YIG nuclease family protein [Candidatus Neomarinimicrobiota bacterium]MBT4452513.1 GIY-YIG nuclease family protein [Candidatus Neomarinimicrobiota bacterium]MBT4735642.1 GIY-YIG nuclease family protein [Candidatus Neomarinimicrobiota bacterium]MBT5385475.1 GIY-YIG nuclease family protein [Candidatus Neomarinimicrobiota bacterium]|tara:strand:- start:2529 stop:2768 length:240 start_codon:yes stop_codon:yes gene_type:complete